MKENNEQIIDNDIIIDNLTYKIFKAGNLDNCFDQTAIILINNVQEILKENKHCEMYFILDDEENNLRYMSANLQAGFEVFSPELKKTAVISVFKDSSSLLKTFSEFNSENNNLKKDNGLNKYIIVDGFLGDFELNFRKGNKFTYHLISECIKNNWDIPYVIGCSSDNEMNESIKAHINLSLSGLPESPPKRETSFILNGTTTALDEREKIINQECPYYINNTNSNKKAIAISIVPNLKY